MGALKLRGLRRLRRIGLPGAPTPGAGGGVLGPTMATFTAGAASGTLIAAITGLATGETIDSVAPNDGRLALDGTRRNLIVGLSAATAGTLAATLTTSAGRTLSMALTVAGGAATVRRAVAYNTNASNRKDTTGAGQWSIGGREGYPLPYDVKAGELIEGAIPMWTIERVSNVITEVELAEAYDFQVAMEYPFADSSTASTILANRFECRTPEGQKTYSHAPGGAYKAVFQVVAPVDIPAGSLIGFHAFYECVAGRSGTVTNKAILRPDNASTFMGRKGGGYASTTSLLSSDPTMTRTAFSAYSATQGGATASFGIGAIRCAVAETRAALMAIGNSIEAGANEGTYNSSTFGDGGGDAFGNKGWATRLAKKIGIGASQVSSGGDKVLNRLVAGNLARRLDWMAWCNPSVIVDMNSHNDTGGALAPIWSAGAPIALDTAIVNVAGGNGYLCIQAGTTGSTAPTGTGTDIVDGTVRWKYVGPDDMTTGNVSRAGIQWVADRRKLMRLYQTAVPGVKIAMPTCPPDTQEALGGSTKIVAASSSYDSGTGVLTMTLPGGTDLTKIQAGTTMLRIAGFTSAGHGTGATHVQVLSVSGQSLTVQRATGLGALAGPGSVDFVWIDKSYQIAGTGYTAGNSFRSWTNRFLRTNPNNALPFGICLDIGATTEAGNPTTPATETAAWAPIVVNGYGVGSGISNDGTHPTSWGNEVIALAEAAKPNVVTFLQAAA